MRWGARRERHRGGPAAIVAALRVGNFRLYFAGQAISMTGTWVQVIGQSWLVASLTGSGSVLGALAAAQFLPLLVAGAYGGLVVDRVNKRRLLMLTQAALAGLAAVLGVLTVTGTVRVWMIFGVAGLIGTVSVLDMPARQSFLPEVVGTDLLPNAVSLTTVMINASRAVGPAIGGMLISSAGVGVCFLANAASFTAVLAALALMRTARLFPTPPVSREAGQLRAGLRYVRSTRGLFIPLVMMALVGTLAFEFPVVLPLLVQFDLGGGSGTYGYLTSAMGVGAVIGGLTVAAWGRASLLILTGAAVLFGLSMAAAALAPTTATEMVTLAVAGAGGTIFLASGNTTLQLTSDPRYRGRVMALWSITFLGSTPIGGPIVGTVAQYLGPRYALGLGALACLAAAGIGAAVCLSTRRGSHERPVPGERSGTDRGAGYPPRTEREI